MHSDINQFRRNFYNNYHNYLIPILKSYEKERVLKLVTAVTVSGILILLGILLLIFTLKYSSKKDCRGGISLIILGYAVYSIIKKNFENKIKERIMDSVTQCFGNEMTWSQHYLDHDIFEDAGVISYYDSVDDDDVFCGKYHDVDISVVESEYERGSGKNRTTIFKGVIIKLKMYKTFRSHTMVCTDTLFHSSPIKGLNRTELEDVEFEKKYDVFTNDPIDARVILTPVFMEKIKNIKMAFKCEKIKCVFYLNNLIIAMPTGTKDLFSIGSLVKPVADPKQFEELLNQFVSILALIDHLELNKNLMPY